MRFLLAGALHSWRTTLIGLAAAVVTLFHQPDVHGALLALMWAVIGALAKDAGVTGLPAHPGGAAKP